MDLDRYFKDVIETINHKLQEIIPSQSAPYKNLFEAARYSINSPGKRLRPIFTLATVNSLQGNLEAAIIPACALEMIHTYSLIHDDLPCMDNDDFRRGLPTLHKVYSEATALLAGDFLLTHSFQILADAPLLSDSKKIGLIALLSRRAGGEELIGGQVMDLEAEGHLVPFETLEMIHLKKTGALISAAFEFGAIIADASEEVQLFFRGYGYEIGLAFQIIDDILDVTQGEIKHGKTGYAVGSDQVNQKFTAVTHLGVEGAEEMASKLIQNANLRLQSFNVDHLLLEKITEYVATRKR